MSDYDDDYGYDDYDDYDGGYDDGGYDDGGYDDGGYDYGDYDHGGYEDHGAHDHDSHDAGEDAVAVEYTGFAVIEEVEGGHDHGSAVDGGGHEDHTGYAEYAHSDDGYQSDHDQALSYGVISGGPSYVQDHDDYPASYSPSQYAPSARGASQPSSAPRGLMVDSQSHGGSYSHRPSSRSSGVHYNGNYHGPGTWNYEEQSLRNHSAGYR
ncbi:hypothetical protein B0H65DRAFT_157795 [Neurospora tetraspora]|uniref:Uncharacterized protein n=1 Tax=Neurospora tetraspora TaxID=94610 RepID=A0AAE0JI18_9PEZI|nr:hypothetical protein B0H65DRAFT_157795 [Neurospora tetraspora]